MVRRGWYAHSGRAAQLICLIPSPYMASMPEIALRRAVMPILGTGKRTRSRASWGCLMALISEWYQGI